MMKVLSLFDGMSCGQIALQRAGINVDKYYASEVEQAPMAVTQYNFPETIQVGDVTKLDFTDFKGEIDILIGGSPCQGLSIANSKRNNLDDPRSALFYKFIEALNIIKPKYFILENVKMDAQSQAEFTRLTGVEPIEINSNLVSAQNRKRLYWTNIPNVTQPVDKGILIRDILDKDNVEYFQDERIEKTKVKTKNYYKWDISGKGYYSQQDRAYFKDGKMCCIPKARVKSKLNVVENEEGLYRRTSVEECERLQTVPTGYTKVPGVSNTKRYEMLGNGWTVDVIAHILKNIKTVDTL